jgi:uptake hydrogenase large subunit
VQNNQQININLKYLTHKISNVQIASSQITNIADIFINKNITQVLEIISCVFSVCSRAQLVSSLVACENATGVKINDDTKKYRMMSVKSETIKEHLIRIYLDWTKILQKKPQTNLAHDILKIHNELNLAIDNSIFTLSSQTHKTKTNDIKKILNTFRKHLEKNIFQTDISFWLQIDNLQDLYVWTKHKNNTITQMIRFILTNNIASAGTSTIKPLPTINENTIEDIINNKDFCRNPMINNECYETTTNTRTQSHLLSDIKNHYGNGILHRVVAIITEVALYWQNIATNTHITTIKRYKGYGIGITEAARGRLIHVTKIKDEKITNYKIISPTSWNFHPNGLLTNAVKKLNGDKKQLKQKIKMLVYLFDPCVDFKLNIN